MANQPSASPELGRLEPFVGAWATEGEMVADRPATRARFKATDTYEWLPGGHFLLHRISRPDGRGKLGGAPPGP